jgi:DNA-binding HxlR family transcriptional regulator
MGQRQRYGQFCPISRAAELLTSRWTPLVVRELYFGSTRFADLQKGLPRMSSALLSQRLKELEHSGIISRHRAENGAGYVHELTEAGRALFPVLVSMGRWAQQHSRDDLTADENLDPDLLMWNIRRRADGQGVAADERFIVEFRFSGVPTNRSRFWLIFKDGEVDLCQRDPGFDVALAVTAHIRTMTRVWLGHLPLDAAIRTQELRLEGDRKAVRSFQQWFRISVLAANGG